MAVEVRVASVAADTSTGNQDITVGGWGSTPDAVILMLARTTGGTADHWGICIGAATASDERWHFGTQAEDNVASADVDRWQNTDSILRMLDIDGVQEAKSDFVEFIAGGCTINWSDAPPSAYITKAIFFAGLENATAGTFDAVAVGNDTEVTPGHTSHIVFLGSAQIANGSETAHQGMSWGVCSNGASITEMCHEMFVRSGADSVSGGWIESDACGIANSGTPGQTPKYLITLDAFTGTTFDANFTGGTSDTTDDWLYLSLELPSGISSKVVSFASPTSGGNDDVTGFGFKPQAIIAGLTHMTATDTGFSASPQADHSGWGVWTGSEEECVSVYNEDEVGTSDTKTDEASTAVDLVGTSGTELEASFVSMDADGFTLNWSTVYTSACYQWALGIEEDAVVGGISVDTANISVMTPVVNASSPQQFNHTCGVDVDALVVVITIYDTSPTDGIVSGVTYNGVPFDTPAATIYYDSLCDGHVSIWLLPSPPTGASYPVSIAFGGVVTDLVAAAVGIEGTVGTFAKDSNGIPATGTTGDLTISWDTLATDTIVFSASLDDQTDVSKVHPQEIEIYNLDVGDVVTTQYVIRDSAGSQSMVVVDDDGDEDWVIAGAAFYEVAAPFGQPAILRTQGIPTGAGARNRPGGWN